MNHKKTGLVGAVVLLVSTLLGCDTPQITSYEVPKGPPVPQRAGAMEAGAATGTAQPPALRWRVPESWRPVSTDGAQGRVTFAAGSGSAEIEISVAEMPSPAGELHANINRWRAQIGLPELTGEELDRRIHGTGGGMLEPLDLAGDSRIRGIFLDIGTESGDSGERIIVAWIDDTFARTWFVKAAGSVEQLDAHRSDLWDFANSFNLGRTAAQPREEGSAGISWKAPDHWKSAASSSSILTAAFEIDNSAGQSRATITELSGRAGGVLANLNRWRQQVGLPAVATLAEHPSETIEIGGLPAVFFDIATASGGPDRPRIRVALLSRGESAWFFKLTGPAAAVEQEVAAFSAFIGSIRFEGDGE